MKKIYFLFLVLGFMGMNAIAQDSTKSKSKWKYLAEIYLMFPTMSGSTSVGNLPPINIDVNSNEIFSHIKGGMMFYFEAGNDKWALTSDLLYMKLGNDVAPSTLINNGTITMKQLGWEVSGLRKISPMFDAGLGIMLNSLEMGADLTLNNVGGGETNRSKTLSKTWEDVLLVARIHNKSDAKFIYQLRGDIGGGFSGNTNFAWQVQAYAGYRFSKLFQATAGYRVIGLDYEDGSGDKLFSYDVNTYGPVIRFGFNF